MPADEQWLRAARDLADALSRAQLRIVLAESCTAGNVAGTLAVIPGISAWLCGSFVIYRNESKAQWLGIPREILDDPALGPVSPPVTRLLAERALAATSEADVGVAVTGHIGPGSPPELDGRVFFALVRRGSSQFDSHTRQLESPAPRDAKDYAARQRRLMECTCWVLEQIRQSLPPVVIKNR